MAVSTNYFAFVYLSENPFPRVSTHLPDSESLFSSDVIKV